MTLCSSSFTAVLARQFSTVLSSLRLSILQYQYLPNLHPVWPDAVTFLASTQACQEQRNGRYHSTHRVVYSVLVATYYFIHHGVPLALVINFSTATLVPAGLSTKLPQ